MINASINLRDALLSTIYPMACRVCSKPVESWRDGVACRECWEIFDAASCDAIFCEKCALPLSPAALTQPAGRLCGRCGDCAFSLARACGPYTGALRESVIWLKIHPQLAPRLRESIIKTFHQIDRLTGCHSIVPAPLHESRLAERGFNQAEVIAQALSRATNLRVDSASLERRKNTDRHRVGMGVGERARSLAGAFHVRAPRLVRGRNLLVIDDVMTTGGTAHEIAQTLLDAGANSVSILTIARAVSQAPAVL